MSSKLRRQKDLIRRKTSEYIEATTQDYAKYLEGSPTYITYYRLDDIATKQDSSLENVHSLTGPNTPNKYQKINDVVIYGVDAMDISNELNEKGLESMVSGEFIMLPDTIKPYPGDFFTFDYEGISDHLFRVDEVQFDRASPRKFYRLSYALYPDNADEIFNNISDDYVLNYDAVGGSIATVVKKASQETAERAKDLVDSLINKFAELFYDEDLDVFALETINLFPDAENQKLHIWSPYLQKFLHDNKILEKYNREILEEFYIVDINERSNPDFFKDLAYRQSLFRKVETQDSALTFQNSLMGVVMGYNMNQIRNLPFFHTQEDYRFARPHDGNEFYFEAFHILNQEYYNTFETLPETHKFVDSSELNANEASIAVGDVIYRVNATSRIIPEDVFLATDTTYFSISFNSLMQNLTGTDAYLANEELFAIVRSYLKDEIVLNDDLIIQLNDFYYDISFKNYILVPIIIFIIKQLIKDAFEN